MAQLMWTKKKTKKKTYVFKGIFPLVLCWHCQITRAEHWVHKAKINGDWYCSCTHDALDKTYFQGLFAKCIPGITDHAAKVFVDQWSKAAWKAVHHMMAFWLLNMRIGSVWKSDTRVLLHKYILQFGSYTFRIKAGKKQCSSRPNSRFRENLCCAVYRKRWVLLCFVYFSPSTWLAFCFRLSYFLRSY